MIVEFKIGKFKTLTKDLMIDQKLLNNISEIAHKAKMNWDMNRIADFWIINFNTLQNRGING